MSFTSRPPRRMWSREEDDMLRRAAESQAIASNGFVKDWCSISKLLPGRTNKDCRKRWSKLTKAVNKGTWSPEEDERLVRAIECCGPSWQLIAEKVGTRHAEQCAKRWQHSLDPTIDRSEWTEEDDKTLMDAVAVEGRSWRRICKTYFPRRSTTDIKNHFEYVSRRRKHSTDDTPRSRDDARPSGEFEGPLSDSSSEFFDDNVLSRPSTRYPSQVPSQHLLTGSHSAPGMMADFGTGGSAGGTPLGYRPNDMLSLNTNNLNHIPHAQPYGNDLAMNGLYASPTTLDSALSAGSDTRSSSEMQLAPFTQMHSHFLGSTNTHVTSWNQHESHFNSSSQMEALPVTTTALENNGDGVYVHEQLAPGCRSPSCTLVLKQVPTENVGMLLNPLVRSGVNVKLQLYNEN